jgi:hypothetical protein
VQGRSDDQRELLDVESVAGHLIKPGSVFGFLAAHRSRLFPAELFSDLFPSRRGRPSVPGEVIATVLVLQALRGLSDREALEALTFDLRWKAACGLAVTDTGFDPSTLTYWRRRLAASARPDRVFEVIAESGAVAGKTRRALDSTILDDAGRAAARPPAARRDHQPRGHIERDAGPVAGRPAGPAPFGRGRLPRAA